MAAKTSQASEDGDYVALRAVREKKLAEKQQRLDKIDEEHPFNLRIDAPLIRQNAASQTPEPCSEPLDENEESLFAAIESGSLITVKDILQNSKQLLNNCNVRKGDKNLLHFALESNQPEIAAYFIENGNDSFLTCEYHAVVAGCAARKNSLHRITEMKNLELASSLLSKVNPANRHSLIHQETPQEISGQRPRTFSCLHLASHLGSDELVNLYLDNGIEVNHMNSKGDTALLWASRWSHIKVMRSLLRRGAKPNLENDKGSTALHWAVRYGHTKAVKVLTGNGATDVNKKRKLGLVTPIVLSSALGHADIVRLLITNGADVNCRIRGKETPIHHAAREGHADVLQILLDNGATLDEEDETGNTALLLAARHEQVGAVQVLVASGATISHKNHDGQDAWFFAIISDGNEMLKALVVCRRKQQQQQQQQRRRRDLSTSGQNDDQQFNTRRSPLFLAAALGRSDKISYLRSLEISLQSRDEDGNSLLHYAAGKNHADVICKFSKHVGVDSTNNSGEAPLHVACHHGYHEAALKLLEKKAKANLKNDRGETPLHVAARSERITPETAHTLVEYAIKSHAWDTLNDTDLQGNNALHIAAKYASPKVLWEYRFVNFKNSDVDGNNPIHESIRAGEPEVFETMLDIFETMKRDANINKKNNKKETVLHLSALEGFKNGVKRLIHFGADLSLQDDQGDSVLHRLTRATISDQKNLQRYLDVFDIIIKHSVRWWCFHEQKSYPDDNKQQYRMFQREAFIMLVTSIYNDDQLSVLSLASKLAAKDILKKIFLMENLMVFKTDTKIYFDITHVTPLTNSSLNGWFDRKQKVLISSSCFDWLITAEHIGNAAAILDIPPLKKVEIMYGQTCAWVYFLLMLLHVCYMTLISFNAPSLLKILRDEKLANSTKSETTGIEISQTSQLILYVITPTEPAIIVLFDLYVLTHHLFLIKNKPNKQKLTFWVALYLTMSKRFLPVLVPFLFSGSAFLWVGLYTSRYKYQDVFLSVTLCVGWLMTVHFTRGFKGVHHFWRMLRIMIVRDVFRFLFVYVFVLFAFSFALHVLFQVSAKIADHYTTPFHTLFLTFNLMVGMGELIDNDFIEAMDAEGRSILPVRLVYLFYIILATTVLLNLLIAMMNDSYQVIQTQQKLSWRLDSIKLGLSIEKLFPYSTRLFSNVRFYQGCIPEDPYSSGQHDTEQRWYVHLPLGSIAQYQQGSDDKRSDLIRALSQRVVALETKIEIMEGRLAVKLDSLHSALLQRPPSK